MNSPAQTTAVLIPAFNAEPFLAELIHRLRLALGMALIVVVDDGSADRTNDTAVSLGAVVLRHRTNCGKGAALQTGFSFLAQQTGIEFILTIDADLQHRPEDAPQFFLAQQKNKRRYCHRVA